MYLIRVQSPEYIKNFYNSTAKRQTTQDEVAMDVSEWLTAPATEGESRPCALLGLSPPEFSWEA